MKKSEYKPMACPVCDKFYFGKWQDGDEYISHYCHCCGWVYDRKQAKYHDLKDGKNEMSVNEYKAWYKSKLAEDPDYDYITAHIPPPQPHDCPVCGKHQFEDINSFGICPHCGWEDDGVLEESPYYAGGANDLCLVDFKTRYQKLCEEIPNYHWDTHHFGKM